MALVTKNQMHNRLQNSSPIRQAESIKPSGAEHYHKNEIKKGEPKRDTYTPNSKDAIHGKKIVMLSLAQAVNEVMAERAAMRRELESSKKQAEAYANALEIQRKCHLIAARISKGDKVPDKDRRYLLEHDPGLYFQSMMMMQYKEKPEKHKSVLDEDEESMDESSESESEESIGETVESTEASLSI